MNENNLRNDSISSLIARFSIPAIVGMVVAAIYNIVDRIFIGQYAGETALASLVVVFPIIMFTFATSVLTGQGGANLISISLGRGSRDDANKYFTNTIVFSVLVNVVISALILFNIERILVAFGASGEVLDYAVTYLSIYLYFIPLSSLSFVLSTAVRAEGFPKLSMNAMLVSALTNIVLDYVFIGVLGLGVAGGAIATGIGQTAGLIIFLAHFSRKKSTLHFDRKNMMPQFDVVAQIMTIGFPSFLSTVGVSVAMVGLNISLGAYGGVAAITSLAAINSLFTFVIMPINGIQGGVQPIIGFNHGAKLRARVKETIFKAMAASMIFALLVFIVMQSVPTFLLSLFIDSGSSTMDGAVLGLRIFILSLPLLPISVLSTGYFQATQKPAIAIFLGLLRQFFLLLPLLYILPKFFGLTGVWLAVPISDFIAIVISFVALVIDFRHTKYDSDDDNEIEIDDDIDVEMA